MNHIDQKYTMVHGALRIEDTIRALHRLGIFHSYK